MVNKYCCITNILLQKLFLSLCAERMSERTLKKIVVNLHINFGDFVRKFSLRIIEVKLHRNCIFKSQFICFNAENICCMI